MIALNYRNTFMVICLSSLLLFGCNDNEDVSGIYVAEFNVNTIDSLVLEKNGIYKRYLRRKIDSSLIFNNRGSWKYDENRINLSDFLVDKDQNYKVRENDSYFKDVLITASLPLKREAKRTIIAIDHNLELYYIKQTSK